MPRARGFTLIELLVVIAIIGVLSSLVVMNVVTADPAKDLQREANRLMAVLEMAQDEALFGRQDIGVIVTENGYSFARYTTPENTTVDNEESALTATNPDLGDSAEESGLSLVPTGSIPQAEPDWVAITDQHQFRPYELPEDYEISLVVDDEMIDITGGKKDADPSSSRDSIFLDDDRLRPAIYLSPSNEMTPFVLEIFLKDDSKISVKLSGDETGHLWIGDDEKG